MAGIGRFIKSMNENVIVAISDPDGSGLYNKVRLLVHLLYHFLMFTS